MTLQVLEKIAGIRSTQAGIDAYIRELNGRTFDDGQFQARTASPVFIHGIKEELLLQNRGVAVSMERPAGQIVHLNTPAFLDKQIPRDFSKHLLLWISSNPEYEYVLLRVLTMKKLMRIYDAPSHVKNLRDKLEELGGIRESVSSFKFQIENIEFFITTKVSDVAIDCVFSHLSEEELEKIVKSTLYNDLSWYLRSLV